MAKKFNPEQWLKKTEPKKILPVQEKRMESKKDPNSKIEKIISRIEKQSIDITGSYQNWRDIGFAFADEFGESGKDYFHRISKFYPDYSSLECDEQYNKCLKSNGHGITMSTFYHFAKMQGVDISGTKIRKDASGDNENAQEKLPLIPDEVYATLPDFLQKICEVSQTEEERDILLLGSLVTLSSIMPNVYGFYHQNKVKPNMYLFLTAKASAGKGLLNHCKQLAYPVHYKLREESEKLKADYQKDLKIYNANKKDDSDAEKPRKPPEKLLFIPANSSATGVFQLLSDNDGKGMIFETEGDTLANTFKSDYGNYSDGFRKAFHHETISYYRRTDKEYVDIESPCLSAVLSGTPKQIINLVPDAENGLFSRFIFYRLEMKNIWKDVFAQPVKHGLKEHFLKLGEEYFTLYNELNASLDISFQLTGDQQRMFNKTFSELQNNYQNMLGEEYTATVRRLGLIAFRMAMIFSVLRIMESGELPNKLISIDKDFDNTLSIIKVLIRHSEKIFSELPVSSVQIRGSNRKQKFYTALPDEFSRKEYLESAESLNITDKTAQNYIAALLTEGKIKRVKHDRYIKNS